MVMDSTTRIYDTATNLYVGWVDASLAANERFARVARVWLDETIGAQQDVAQTVKRAIEEAQTVLTQDGETDMPITFISRVGDLARVGYYLCTESCLRSQ